MREPSRRCTADSAARSRWLSPVVTRENRAGAESNSAAVMRPGAAERMLAGLGLVADISDDVGAIRNARHRIVELEAHHPVAELASEIGTGVHVDEAIRGELRVDRNAHHAGLSVAEQVGARRGIPGGRAHAVQLVDGADEENGETCLPVKHMVPSFMNAMSQANRSCRRRLRRDVAHLQ